MPRLTQDPNLVEKPDFASAAYDTVCQALAAAEQITREAVAARLADAWDVDNNAKIAAWEQQLREDQEAEAEATLARELATNSSWNNTGRRKRTKGRKKGRRSPS